MSGGGVSRVPISVNARKLIQEIKKTVGSKHSDEFMYSTLKDCDMDPDEASLRLKMIHDVGEIAGKHSTDDVYAMLKECNMDPNEAAQRLLYIDTFHEVKKKRDRRKTIGSDASEEYRRTRGSQWRGARVGRGAYHSSKVSDDVNGGRALSSAKEYGATKPSERIRQGDNGKENNVAHVASSSAVDVHSTLTVSNGSYKDKLTPKLSPDVSSFTSVPVVGPSRAVGTIKCEIVKGGGSSESDTDTPVGIESSAGPVVAGTVQATAENVDSSITRQLGSDSVEKTQLSEFSQLPFLMTQDDSQAVDSGQDCQASHGPPKVDASEHVSHSDSPKESSPKLDRKLEKLTLTSHPPVIFPDHLQVPETFKSQFTFGSLDAIPDGCGSISTTESTQHKISKVITEPSPRNKIVAASAQEGDSEDHPLPNLSENALASQDNISSDTAVKHDRTKPEMMPPVGGIGGFQNPLHQTNRDYNFGLMPHLLGPLFVPLDAPELKNGSSPISSTAGPPHPVTQPASAAGQSSIPLSPPLFPYFRQPYPNYFPYNPYFPPMYLPQNAHLLNHGVFLPQPPGAGNVYVQAAAAAGVKPPVPSPYKQGSLTRLGIPSGPGPHPSSVGYGAAVNPGGSSASDDLKASQMKDDNRHPPVPQGEDPPAWASAGGRDVPNLHPSYFYNFPHHMPFPPLQTGLYHPSQTMAPHPLPNKSEPTAAAVEPMVPPSGSYQHPTQPNWNPTLLNREAS